MYIFSKGKDFPNDRSVAMISSLSTSADESLPLISSFSRFTTDSIVLKEDDIALQTSMKNLRRYTSPRIADVQVTKALQETMDDVTSYKDKVIHIFGTPGNGKSHIVRTICKTLDYGERVIWHVQSSESKGIVKQQWNNLISEMTQVDFITEKQAKEIQDDLNDGHTKTFLDALVEIGCEVLLAIEDFSDEEKPMLQNFVGNLLNTKNHKVKLLLATQTRESLFCAMDLLALREYKTKRIMGFEQSEAEDFLRKNCVTIPHSKGSGKLAEALAYSPLRLVLAKAYCNHYCESYHEYYEDLGHRRIISREREILDTHRYLAEHHGYDVIMKSILKLKEEEIRVVKMISFLMNGSIPDVLIGRFFQEIHRRTVEEEGECVRDLLVKLKEYALMETRYILDDEREYGKGTLSTHMDILCAVNYSLTENEREILLVDVLHGMIGLVHKDNRVQKDDTLLYQLLDHAERIVANAEDLFTERFNLENPEFETFELQIGLSWLHEVIGFISTQHRKMRDGCFEKAIDYLWSIASSYSSGRFICRKTKSADDLFQYNPEKGVEKVAKTAKKLIKNACKKIPVKFVERHYMKFFPVEMKFLQGMKSSGKFRTEDGHWEEMEKVIKERRSLSDAQISYLRKRKMLLTPKQLHQTFLSDRLASVLHSRGRQLLYIKDEISKEDQKCYEWYTELGIELSKVFLKEETNFHSIFEFILIANNQLPHLLQNLQNVDDSEFISRLEKTKKLANEAKKADGDYFEHGIYVHLSHTPYTLLNAQKYLVKANTKIYKRRELAINHPFPGAMHECSELLQLAKDNPHFVMAANCRVQAGKFYAATRNYKEALNAFESAFDQDGKGINNHLEDLPNTYAWAVYNYGTALHCGWSKLMQSDVDVAVCKKRFKQRYDNAVKLDIAPEWMKKLEDCNERISHLIS